MLKTVKQIDGFEIETIDYTQDEEPDIEQDLIDYWIEVYGYDKFNAEQRKAFLVQWQHSKR